MIDRCGCGPFLAGQAEGSPDHSDDEIGRKRTLLAEVSQRMHYWGAMATDKNLDHFDLEILRLIGEDASMSLADIAGRVGLTPTPCWKRIRRMENEGVILRRVAVLDPIKVGLPVSVFVEIETADHSKEWLARFAALIAGMPEIVDAWRMSGNVDYLLYVMVRDIGSYDAFYRKLIGSIPLRNVSSRFSMERLKDSALPI
jgi:Lrp/AsnC family transcriptional regulator